MSAAIRWNLVSVDEYLAGELDSPIIQHEYLAGVVYAMAGKAKIRTISLPPIRLSLWVLAYGVGLVARTTRILRSGYACRTKFDSTIQTPPSSAGPIPAPTPIKMSPSCFSRCFPAGLTASMKARKRKPI